jgi:hypothetical protein
VIVPYVVWLQDLTLAVASLDSGLIAWYLVCVGVALVVAGVAAVTVALSRRAARPVAP